MTSRVALKVVYVTCSFNIPSFIELIAVLIIYISSVAWFPFIIAFKKLSSLQSKAGNLCNNKHFSQAKIDLLSVISKDISVSINRPFNSIPASADGYGAGGGGASVGVIINPNT